MRTDTERYRAARFLRAKRVFFIRHRLIRLLLRLAVACYGFAVAALAVLAASIARLLRLWRIVFVGFVETGGSIAGRK